MASPPGTPLLDTPVPQTAAMPSTPLQSSPLDMIPRPHEGESRDSPSLLENSSRPSLSSADCRALQKILHDARSPSPPSTIPCFGNGTGYLSRTGTKESYNSNKVQYDHGDERDEGYEDEDDSMELTDDEEVSAFVAASEDDDTIEDVMDLPGKTAPPAPIQEFGSFYPHDGSTPDETKEMQLRRASIEKELEKQRLEQENQQAEEIGIHPVEDEDETTDALEVNPTRYCPGHPSGTWQALDGFGSGSSPFTSTWSHTRRASEGSPLLSASFINIPDTKPAIVQTPGGKHIDFAPNINTPFTPTLNYFKQYQGKENSPSKRRCNASSPEEIAELAREAAVEEDERQEEAELQELEQYRELDLAPIEPVMESKSAGDLITFGTPAKACDASVFDQRLPESEPRPIVFGSRGFSQEPASEPTSPPCQSLEEAVNLKVEDHRLRPSKTPSPRRLTLPLEQDEDHDADIEESDSSCDSEEKRLILYPQDPTFITVIGMLPAAMFWAAAAPAAKYSNKALDTLIEKLTGLKIPAKTGQDSEEAY